MYMSAVVLKLAWVGAFAWPILLTAAFLFVPLRLRSRFARVAAGVISFAWAVGVWSFLIEPQTLVVRDVRIESDRWTGPPLRIGVIADVHIGPHMSPARAERIVRRMNGLSPDLVLLPGDFIGGHFQRLTRSDKENSAIERGVTAFGGFTAPLGTVAVLGNHDWYYDGPGVDQILTDAGVPVLENNALRIERPNGEDFWVAGLAARESFRAQPDWAVGLSDVPDDAEVVVLAHRPNVFWHGAERVAVTIVGHTHCGQINLPIYGRHPISSAAKRWMCGLYDERGQQGDERSRLIYVSGGVGVSILPVRFRVPPEIAVLTLTAASPGEG